MEDETEKQQQPESGHCSHHYGTALRGVKTSLAPACLSHRQEFSCNSVYSTIEQAQAFAAVIQLGGSTF